MMRNQKGITLIALVITIIVLLILAGVSIAMLTGQNGILKRATQAKSETSEAALADKINMALNGEYAALLADGHLTGEELDTDGSIKTATTADEIASAEGISTTEFTISVRTTNTDETVLEIKAIAKDSISGKIKYASATKKYSIEKAKYPGE